MKGFYLTPNQLDELHLAHRQKRNKRYAYRIHTVILLGTGYTLKSDRKLKTNSGRQRLNLHGGINVETHEITIKTSRLCQKLGHEFFKKNQNYKLSEFTV